MSLAKVILNIRPDIYIKLNNETTVNAATGINSLIINITLFLFVLVHANDDVLLHKNDKDLEGLNS